MKNHESRGGYTLIELALSILLLLLVVGVPVRFMATVGHAQRELDATTALNARATRTLERLTLRLQDATLTPAPPASPGVPPVETLAVDYEVARGYTPGAAGSSGTPDFDTPERIELLASPSDPANGVDDDGDGLVDEGRIVWSQGGPVIVLCENVPRAAAGEIPGNGADDNGNTYVDEPGFLMVREQGLLRVLLTLSDVDADGNRITATAEQVIALRCRPPSP
jgi:hypothetical protein